MPLGDNIAIIGGGLVGLELAEFLAERGRAVTVLERGAHLGAEMAHPRRWRALHEARAHGVHLVTEAKVQEITPAVVHYRVGDDDRRIEADNVIIADGVHADSTLADKLQAEGWDIREIGDGATVGYIEGAIRSAYDLALAL